MSLVTGVRSTIPVIQCEVVVIILINGNELSKLLISSFRCFTNIQIFSDYAFLSEMRLKYSGGKYSVCMCVHLLITLH